MSPANIVEMLTEVGINPADGNVSYEGMNEYEVSRLSFKYENVLEFCSALSLDKD